MKKQVGAFDDVAELLEDSFGQWVNKTFEKRVRLAARLLRVAGRAKVWVGTFDGFPLGELTDDSGDKLARIIHRAQTLQGKAQERTLAGKSKQGRRV